MKFCVCQGILRFENIDGMKNIQSEQLLTDATNAPTKHHVEHDACKMTREFL